MELFILYQPIMVLIQKTLQTIMVIITISLGKEYLLNICCSAQNENSHAITQQPAH